MLASLLLLHSLSAAVAADPPVRVWFNSDGHYEFGDRAKVYAQTADDGYLDDSTVRADPEAGLLDLVQRMRGAGDHFDFDVASYTVEPPPRYVGWVSPYAWSGWWDPWYAPRIAVGLRFGDPYYYRPFVGPGRWRRW